MTGQRQSQVLQAMQDWLERAVIGLNLCPFAKAVQVKQQIHWVVSPAVLEGEVLDLLRAELQALVDAPASLRDTTVLVLPHVWPEFLEMHTFLPRAERCLRQAGFEGVLQIAPFHPGFEFFDAPPQDMGHFVNRAPYPALHLLREASIARALAGYAAAETIEARNLALLRQMGLSGWQALRLGPHPEDPHETQTP